MMETFTTSYKNEAYIINDFKRRSYWDINSLKH